MPPYPLVFKPLLKQTIWGGRLLGERLGKSIGDDTNYAESWEIVDHGQDQSVVESGPLAGKSLHELLTHHRRWLVGGKDASPSNALANDNVLESDGIQSNRFPLLLKYLDCNRVLSVQVHPSDDYGLKMSVPDRGKTEAWFVVDAKPDSVIYAGLKEGVTASELRQAIHAGQTEQVLHQFHPTPGDCVFIPAGTVHAIGAGVLIAEIQQASNTTFRLFDWDRTDADGNSRPLHIEESFDVIDFAGGPVKPIHFDPSLADWQTLVECDKFRLRAVQNANVLVGDDDQFHILTVPQGTASLNTKRQSIEMTTGTSLLLPAAHDEVELQVGSDSIVLEMS
ncbi:type I phosphomannose isomerase catalytic subunit [Novipirellula aureliae]|uniref:type I phosphomannose isomerase catalytic subunit n=1 Tax=Novipirellula aureliae TaxID=2527966 RepID=UPI0011B46884